MEHVLLVMGKILTTAAAFLRMRVKISLVKYGGASYSEADREKTVAWEADEVRRVVAS